MGGRGSSSNGDNSVLASKKIKEEFLRDGLNSKFKGVRRNAEQGTGNYLFKGATPVGEKDALKIDVVSVREKNGKTLVIGLIGQKDVVFGADNNNKTLAKVLEKKASRDKRLREEAKPRHDLKQTTTTTYDRWKSSHDKEFADWFFQGDRKKHRKDFER